MPDSSREEIAKLEALYANNPAGRVFTHLAEAYRKAGEYERARGILNEGLQKHPGYASAYVVMGRVLIDLHENDEAANAFRQVLDLDPHNLIALQSLGELARGAGRAEEAIRYFEQLRQHDPGNDEIEQILNDLRAPDSSFEAHDVSPPLTETPAEPISSTEEWRPEPTSYEPAQSSWVEPDAEVESSADGEAGFASMPDIEREPEAQERDPWQQEPVEPETDTPEPAAPFGTENAAQDFSLGWTVPEPEPPPASDELGDLSSIGKAAEAFEVEGETFAPEDIDLDVSELERAATNEDGDDVVMTETIAELYRRQGLYDRAADVYHKLLEARPNDADLQAKLAEVEAMNQPAEPEPAGEPWSEPDPWESPEPDTEQAAAWLAGASEPTESLPTPYAWTEQPQDVATDSGRLISVYFHELLSWQPRAAAAPVSEAATAAEAFDEWFGGAETASQEQPVPQPMASSPREEPKSEEGEDDDDDLEMFRSWLQSLKK